MTFALYVQLHLPKTSGEENIIWKRIHTDLLLTKQLPKKEDTIFLVLYFFPRTVIVHIIGRNIEAYDIMAPGLANTQG